METPSQRQGVPTFSLYSQIQHGFRWVGYTVANKLRLWIACDHVPQRITKGVILISQDESGTFAVCCSELQAVHRTTRQSGVMGSSSNTTTRD